MFLIQAFRGLVRAAGAPRLVALLWLFNLVFALVATLPMAFLLFGHLGDRPEGDRLLDGMQLDLLAFVSREGGGLGAAIQPVLLAAIALALLANALLSGGVLESLTTTDPRPFLHRFGRGAGRFFWRFLRMGLAAVPTAVLAAVILAGPLFFARRRMAETGPETTRFVLLGLGLMLAIVAIAWVTMALDLARIRVVREDRRKPIRLFFRTFGTALRHPVRVLGLWCVNTVAFLALVALFLALRALLPSSTWLGIVALVALQQLLMIGRSTLRVGLWASELELAKDLARRHGWGAPPAPRSDTGAAVAAPRSSYGAQEPAPSEDPGAAPSPPAAAPAQPTDAAAPAAPTDAPGA